MAASSSPVAGATASGFPSAAEERLVSGGGRLGAAAGLAAVGGGAAVGAAAGAGAKRDCTIGDGGCERGRGGCVELCSCLAVSSRLIAPGDGMSLGGFFGWLSISNAIAWLRG